MWACWSRSQGAKIAGRDDWEEVTLQLTLMQLWALLAGGPIAMVLTVLVGILVNNAITTAHIAALRSDI